MELGLEYFETYAELNDLKLELIQIKNNSLIIKNKKLKEIEKTYRKLSDIEIVLSKMECHTNEQLKINRFMAKMVFCLVQLQPTGKFVNHDKVVTDYWREFCRISD